ncbi:MAG: YnfA family protein [Acidimicrobiia bacterium]
MVVAKTAAIFLVAVVGELGGAYAIWRWRRQAGPAWLIGAGLGALFLYALVQTYQPQTSFGRLYAAYAGVFLIGAMTWGWLLDGHRPDTADLIGASLVLGGIGIILWGRNVMS